MTSKSSINYRLLILDIVCLLATGYFYYQYVNWDYGSDGMYLPLCYFLVISLSFPVLIYFLVRRGRLFFSREKRLSTWLLLIIYIIIFIVNLQLIRNEF